MSLKFKLWNVTKNNLMYGYRAQSIRHLLTVPFMIADQWTCDQWSAIQFRSHFRQKNSLSKSTDRRFPSTHFYAYAKIVKKRSLVSLATLWNTFWKKRNTKNRVQLIALHLIMIVIIIIIIIGCLRTENRKVHQFNHLQTILRPLYVYYVFHCVEMR